MTALTIHQPPEAFTREWAELVRQTVCDGASDAEMGLFLYQCKKTGLDPLAKQIYMQRRFNKKKNRQDMTIITGIDGYRLTAQRTGQYAGSDDAIFDSEESPRKATVTVYRLLGGVRCAFTASARWDQYYPGDDQGFMWRKMPHLMLGKCAEALALRKAFPQELSGLYVREEMEQAGKEPPETATEVIQIKSDAIIRYHGGPEKQKALNAELKRRGVDEKHWAEIDKRFKGRDVNDLLTVVTAVVGNIPADEPAPEDEIPFSS